MLTVKKIRNAKARETPYKLADGGGLTLLVKPNGGNLTSGAERVYFDDVATNPTLTRSVGLGFGSSWTLSPSIDETAPNILVAGLPGSSTSAIQEIDLDSHAEVSLPAVSGYGVDSAY